jgi:hypothetical protein
MSEYQRYEFMTSDRPLSREQLDAVNRLSSHIEASSTHALIEYSWGDFKHDPIDVLYRFFDGFLYWANWGAPQLAMRFPHGVVPATLLDGYDLDEFVTLARHPDYDTLDIHFGEIEGPDEWIEYELGALMPIRNELMEGDLRALYIVWLAAQRMMGSSDEAEDYEIDVPPIPRGLATLTSAQQALAELLQLPRELIVAATKHSASATPAPNDDFAAWLESLPPERRKQYLVRLARNEPGLSRLLVAELRALRPDQRDAGSPSGERVTYAALLAESNEIKAQLERERREEQQRKQQRHLQHIHDHQDEHWQRIAEAVERGSGAGYDEANKLLMELREVAGRFDEKPQFEERFRRWVQPHLRRKAFVKRLQDCAFTLPEAQ